MTDGKQATGPEKRELESILVWFPPLDPLHVLEIGCGTAEALGQLLESGRVVEFVGVDLDETAIERARTRWTRAAFICADAARLPSSFDGSFDVVLLRRPDLFAQPRRWREVFGRISTLLRPGGRVIVVVIGEAEASVAYRWLEEGGLRVIQRGEGSSPLLRVLVAEAPFPVTWEGPGEGMVCDARTGECL